MVSRTFEPGRDRPLDPERRGVREGSGGEGRGGEEDGPIGTRRAGTHRSANTTGLGPWGPGAWGDSGLFGRALSGGFHCVLDF